MADQLALTALLEELGQGHIFDGWPPPGEASANKQRFFAQVAQLDASYPGGLRAYVTNGRKLLADSKSGVNPLDGWIPSVPTGTSLEFASPVYTEHEAIGESEIGGCGFVLVAGGLGERLGFSGIKVALPYQITTEEPYLKLYISSILALQQRATELTGKEVELPLAIMVSEDTAAGTEELLKTNGFFGMKASQVRVRCRVPVVAPRSSRTIMRPAGDSAQAREGAMPVRQRGAPVNRSKGSIPTADEASRPRRRPLLDAQLRDHREMGAGCCPQQAPSDRPL